VLDALTYAGHLPSLAPLEDNPGFRFVRGDIRDRELVERLLREEAIPTIVHFAAESHVDRSIDGPALTLDVNIGGTHSLLEAARSVWLESPEPRREHRFHHVSTDEVFGSLAPEEPPSTETSHYAPNSPYAASKAAADHLVRAWGTTYGLQATVSNCSNNYGPLQFPEKLIPLCILNLLEGKTLPIYGDGANVRDWLYVEDHCRAIERILIEGRAGQTYNLGGESESSNLELVGDLCDLVDTAFAADAALRDEYPQAPPARGERCRELITFVEDRPGHDRRYAIDTTKTRRQLGFAPSVSLQEGLARTVRWYLDTPAWWRPLRSS
jgi:dTDP-glucose 4,6-dehydratase